jgi:hypothetical protein
MITAEAGKRHRSSALTSREHIIGLEPLKNGLMGTLIAIHMKSDRKTNISTTFKT